MNKGKQIHRREAMKAIAVGPATFLPLSQLISTSAHAQTAASAASAAADAWKPKFFTASQNELVTALADLIIPETDTPGAREAKVNGHIDLVLSEQVPGIQQAFLNGLRWIDRKSHQLFGTEFLELSEVRQNDLLTRISSTQELPPEDELGHRFFLDIRARTVFAYYTSRIGIHQELEYKGKTPLAEWVGCPHPEHHDTEGETNDV